MVENEAAMNKRRVVKINRKQEALLTIVYRYRFINILILEELWRGIDRSVIRRRLELLRKHGYVDRFYGPEYRLRGMPATYYLLPAGINALRRTGNYHESALRPMYKNRSVSGAFIEHTLRAAELSVSLGRVHPGLEAYTPVDLYAVEHVPRRTVDGLLRLGARWFLLVYIKDSATTPYKQQLIRISQYFESMEWEINMDAEFPAVLLACETPSLEAAVARHAARLLFAAGAELDVYTAAREAIRAQADPAAPLWRPAGEDEEAAVALGDL